MVFTDNQVLTAGLLNSCFDAKQDAGDYITRAEWDAVKNAVHIDAPSVAQSGDLYNFSVANNLTSTTYKDIGEIVEPASGHYYTSLASASTDINNKNYDNAQASSVGAVAQIFRNGNVQVLKLLSNTTIDARIDLNESCIVDLNGFTITNDRQGFACAKDCIFYGMKSGSRIESSQNATRFIRTSGTNISILGGTYYTNMTTFAAYGVSCFIEITTESSQNVNISVSNADVTFIIANQDYPRSKIFNIFRNARTSASNETTHTNYIIENSNILLQTLKSSSFIIFDKTLGDIIIKNCDIVCETPYDDGDNTEVAFDTNCSCNHMLIDGSTIYGTNYAVGTSGKNEVYINNSTLKGRGHGGLYARNGSGVLRIKDTTLVKEDGSIIPSCNYSFSAYFGYNTTSYLDNVKFTSFNNNYNVPALSSSNGNATVYFSNCKMDDIRVDTGCYAYIGAGMPTDIKDSCDGVKLINTNDGYRYELDENVITVGNTKLTEAQLQRLLQLLS